MRIKTLSLTVANQIAAGEVIENPASVVKELLENALDAHATAITIDIGFGGLNQIKISDNGEGIIADDLPLAIAPHATSKLTQLADLSSLSSMGFRGEALASIASIARVTLSSKPATQAHAMQLHLDGENVRITPCARNQGTTVDVRDLFYNAPVRRRFLKSERAEYLAIEHVVKRFALSAPEMTLTLKHNDRLVIELPAATHQHNLRIRIQRLLGKAFIENAIQLDVERAGMQLMGWLSGPSLQFSQNNKQWVYLNQRMVKDKLIQHALKHAYDNRLYPGKYPACLLYLSMPMTEVDVNVHPTKHEVRFQQPRLVHDFIASQVTEALMRTDTSTPVIASDSEATSSTKHGALDCIAIDRNDDRNIAEAAMTETVSYVKEESPSYTPQNRYPSPKPWHILNSQFGLLTWRQHPYLFDIQRAQLHHGMVILSQATLPLKSRPLLVPFCVEHKQDRMQLQHVADACLSYGLRIDLQETHLRLLTIPILMPQLNIKAVLTQVIEVLPTVTDIPALLVAHQTIDVSQLSAENKDALAHSIHQQLEQNKTPSWCLRLDLERCQELMSA